MNWLTSFLNDYGAITAAFSALALGAFNLVTRWVDNKQKVSLDLWTRRELSRIDLANRDEQERALLARHYETEKLNLLKDAVSNVNRLRDRVRSIVASNGVKDYIASKTVLEEFRDIATNLEKIHGSPTTRLIGEPALTGVHSAKRLSQDTLSLLIEKVSSLEYFPVLEADALATLSNTTERLAFVRDSLNEAFLAEILPIVQSYRTNVLS